MGIIARFAHLLRTDAVYGFIDLVRPVRPMPKEEPAAPIPPAPRRQKRSACVCPTCGKRIQGLTAYFAGMMAQHARRCTQAGPESRSTFKVKGRWPKKRRAA